ncbi:MAG: AAA family ATPase [Bryobacteraceae bacterium]
MVNVITIEREYGAGGGAIARKLAERLGWALWDREITTEIARRLHCDVHSVEEREERLDPTYYRLLKVFMRGSYEASFSGSNLELLDSDGLFRLFETVVKEIASRGSCVIVGRGGSYYLRDFDSALRVFIYAPPENKIGRLVAQGKSRAEAEELVTTVDQERAAFVKKYHAKTWPLRELYHLMINSQVGDETVLKMILTEMELLNGKIAGVPG